jgi:hypothetical protein
LTPPPQTTTNGAVVSEVFDSPLPPKKKDTLIVFFFAGAPLEAAQTTTINITNWRAPSLCKKAACQPSIFHVTPTDVSQPQLNGAL